MTERSYEIQTFTHGDWKIQAFFDDKELALLEARRMVQSRRYPALRVVEEYWDPSNETYRTRVIFRESEVDRHNQRVAEERAELRREAEEVRARRQRHHQRRARKAAERGGGLPFGQTYVGLTLKGLGIFLAGVGAIVILNMLAG